MDIAQLTARKLAGKSSRRQFFKFLGVGSLGAGLFLTRTGVSLGAIQGCVGCGGGPCNNCFSPATVCENIGFACKTCQQGGGCPEGCITSGEWFCCLNSSGGICRQRCSECNCGPNHDCSDPACHCFTNLSIPCAPRLHSGDQPCPCPPVKPPIPDLAH
jgi:hypothetical protein